MLKCEFLKRPLQGHFEIPSLLTGGLQSLQPQFSGKNDTAILGSVQWVATPVEHNRAMGNIVKSSERYRKESRSESPSLPCVGSSGNHLGTVFDSFPYNGDQWRGQKDSERRRKASQRWTVIQTVSVGYVWMSPLPKRIVIAKPLRWQTS